MKGVEVNWIGLYALVRREVARVFRVIGQTLAAPLVSAFLFIFIFGFILGQKIDLIGGIPYMQFVFPGILMMNILTASFMHASNGIYFARFIRTIEEILVAPLSYVEMVTAYVVSALVRAFLIGAGILVIGIIFGAVEFARIELFIFYTAAIAIVFALLGIIVGLWAKGFEQLNILNTFIIMPLSFLGGMFYSIDLLPELAQKITLANPIFYFIDGMRFAMTGYHESNLFVGLLIIGGLILGLGLLVWYLFKTGWRLRE